MILEQRYRELCATPSDIYLHLPRMVELVRKLNAQHVIELGTRTGVSTIAWLYALEQTGGRLTSVDVDAQPPIGEWAHWQFIQGDDCEQTVFTQLDPADIVFIDTSHAYLHTVRELNLYRWLVNPGGVIICHDTELMYPGDAPPSDPRFPVRRAIEDFTTQNGYHWENISGCWGLGVIYL